MSSPVGRVLSRPVLIALGLLLAVVLVLVVLQSTRDRPKEGSEGAGREDGGDATQSAPVMVPVPSEAELDKLARDAVRGPLVGERFYFVLPDRFANGDERNDRGGLEGERDHHGFDPADPGFYHGGDLAGLRDQLDYLEGLGVTAIWMTPVMANRTVQGSGEDTSAAYHGYWVTDFTDVDPHLGSMEDLEELVDEAHQRDIKVFLDIITNHTADVIDYEEESYDYRPVGEDPYTPVFRVPQDAEVKAPEWLNDPERYHNRGNSTFEGESSVLGDFFGLDDLATEQEEVVTGMVDIYNAWVDVGVDGFRIDTVKHVDLEFWQRFAPAVLDHARAAGNEDFFMFGEVYDANPANMSTYTTSGELPATLDFGFQAAATDWVKGGPASRLQQLYDGDDWYTDADSNASLLPSFLGNHDMGRAAHLYGPAALRHGDLPERLRLAHTLMFLTRGQPVVYYGDEQGFVGRGGDKDARQDMMATRVDAWAEEDGADGEPMGDGGHFDTDAPLYRHIAELSALREEHPVLAEGAQIVRATPEGSGVFAASRVLAKDGVEYLVLINNGTQEAEVSVATSSPGATFELVWGSVGDLATAQDGTVTATLGPLEEGAALLRASQPMPTRTEPLPVTVSAGALSGRGEIRADVGDSTGLAVVTFLARAADSDDEWIALGTDDAPPYRVFPDVSSLPEGEVEVLAVAKPWSGPVSGATTTTIVAAPAAPPAEGEPALVVAAGTFQVAAGCPQDWDPSCEATALRYDVTSQRWSTDLDLPSGAHELKIALDGSWDENYGADGVRDGTNVTVPDGGAVTVTYDHSTHQIEVQPRE